MAATLARGLLRPLRLVGGRRPEAIAPYEQLLALDVSDDAKATARAKLVELRGPGKAAGRAPDNTQP